MTRRLSQHPREEHAGAAARRAGSSAESGSAAGRPAARHRHRSYKPRASLPPGMVADEAGCARRYPVDGPPAFRYGPPDVAALGPRAVGALPASSRCPEAPARRRRCDRGRRSRRRSSSPPSAAATIRPARSRLPRARRGCFRPGRPPSSRSRASARCTLQLPVNQSRITAIGYYAASDGALGLDADRLAGEPGPPEARRTCDLRRRLGIAAVVPAPRRRRTGDLGARRRRAARNRRLLARRTARSSGSRRS